MQSVVVDKISSVALAADLTHEIRISEDIPCEEGVLVAAEVLNSKSSYNTLELTSGRMARVKQGDHDALRGAQRNARRRLARRPAGRRRSAASRAILGPF